MIKKILHLGKIKALDLRFINVIIILQLVIAFLLFNITIGKLQHSMLVRDTINAKQNKNSLYLVSKSQYWGTSQSDKLWNEIESTLVEEHLTHKFGRVLMVNSQISSNPNSMLLIYNESIVEHFVLPLSTGHWFSKRNTNDVNQIILGYSERANHKLNEIISLTTTDKTGGKIEAKCKIIGFLSKPNYYISFNSGGDDLTVNNLLEKDKSVAIISGKNIDEYKAILNSSNEIGKIIFLESKNATDLCIKILKSKVSALVDISTIENMDKLYIEQNKKTLALQFAHWIIVVCLAITGIGGVNALRLLDEEREYAIYFVCGLRWFECIFLVIVRDLVILFLAFIISQFILLKISTSQIIVDTIIDIRSNTYSIILLTVIFIFTSGGSIIKMYRNSPIKILREAE